MNTIMITGYVGKTPKKKVSRTERQIPYCKFDIATKDQNPEKPDIWIRVTAFGKLASKCSNSIAKGALISVKGKLENDNYSRGDEIHEELAIIAHDIEKLRNPSGAGAQDKEEKSGFVIYEDGDIPC